MAGKRKQAVRGRSGQPAWLWLLVGLVIGAALASFVFLGGYAPTLRGAAAPTAHPDAKVAEPSAPGIADRAGKDKDYDFYTVLPEMEVVIPDAELSATARKEGKQPAASGDKPAAGSRYLLQAGSFSDAGEADALKAKLALLGFVANVEAVTINGETWNRVRLGPYASASKLEADKTKLAANGISALALKENH